ncbi:MAG: FtsW/RodA/SpoVE family cell cycle protein [Firmicutes bacterium]|nr:FtsW/RodA/SpoVE family cell cycle protein [Bacillota bacterium]
MSSLKNIADYVELVCGQIRWKKARARVAVEMKCHIEDGRDFYIAQGLDEKTATDQAIADTGDATQLGTDFDRVHRPKPQWGMLGAVAAFLALGIVLSLLIHDGGDLQRRLFFTAIGIVVMLAAYFLDFTVLVKTPMTVLFVFLALTILSYGIFWTLPPHSHMLASRLALILPLYLAICIFQLKVKGYLGISIICVGFFVLIIVAGYGTVFNTHFFVTGMAIFLVAIWKNWFGVNKIVGSLIALVPFFIVTTISIIWGNPARAAAIINPASDPLGFGFQSVMTRLTLSYSNFVGHGGFPRQFPYPFTFDPTLNPYVTSLANFLPDATSNLVLTVVIYRYGWLAFMVIMAAILGFIAAGFMRCFKQRSGLGFLVSFAVMATFTFQVATYVLINLGIGISPISLPLISPGNVATVVNMGLIGFMLSVFRTGELETD